jgi:hypothetical protein
MTEPSTEFRNQLLNVENISPDLREGYRRELDAMLHPPLTKKSGATGIVLLTMLVICVGLIVRADLVYHVQAWMLVAHIALAVGFTFAAMLILRDLRKWKNSPKSVTMIANTLTLTAGIITVLAMMHGLKAPSDTKTLFGVFYLFVFYFACSMWSLDRRIASAELASREQSLRIECCLADLADRLAK